MATVIKKVLSSSNLGQPVSISSTAGGTYQTIHTTVTGTGVVDEVFLWAQNNFSAAVDLVLEWGTTATNAQVVTRLPARDGLSMVVPGIPLHGSACASVIAGYVAFNASGSLVASSAFVTVTGYVNRITQ